MNIEVYFSSSINNHAQYGNDFEKIKNILDRNRITYDYIYGTKDIWCRDYMPVRNGKNELVQFQYEPTYLQHHASLKTNPEHIRVQGAVPTNTHININLDGGNYVKCGNKVIITERIFSENNIGTSQPSNNKREEQLKKVFETPFNAAQQKMIRDLENLMGLEVIIIPAYGPELDLTGHSDGYMRFVHENLVLVSSLQNEYKEFSKGCIKAIEKHNLEWAEMPSFLHEDPINKNTAIGCYMNYLELEDVIVFPIFDIYPRTDEKALKTISKYFPNKKIEPVIINDIANDGGLMNCISWEG